MIQQATSPQTDHARLFDVYLGMNANIRAFSNMNILALSSSSVASTGQKLSLVQ